MFVCFLDSDDLWNPDFLERHLAAHLNETYAVGFTACNARLINGQDELIAGGMLDEKVLRVVGLASADPLNKQNVFSSENRRIAIVLLREAPVLPTDTSL